MGHGLCAKINLWGLAGAQGGGFIRTSVELVSEHQWTTQMKEPQQSLLKTADTSSCQHEVVGAGAWIRSQLSIHRAGQGSVWNSLGARAWGLLGLGLTGRQGTAGKVRLGWGPSLEAPARFWQGPKATQRAGLCAKRAKGTGPAQAAVARGRRLVSGQRGEHHGRPVVSSWLVFTFSSQGELGHCPLPDASSLCSCFLCLESVLEPQCRQLQERRGLVLVLWWCPFQTRQERLLSSLET